MGGFEGTDNAPSTAQLSNWVASGQLEFVLGQATTGGGGSGGGGGVFGASTATKARSQWVQQHCAVVNPSAYGGSAGQSTGTAGPFGGGGGGAQTLYQCTSS
jgi:hypothetical protein